MAVKAGAPRVCGDDPRLLELRNRRRVGAPRVCGDDPYRPRLSHITTPVLPAYAGMIPRACACPP